MLPYLLDKIVCLKILSYQDHLLIRPKCCRLIFINKNKFKLQTDKYSINCHCFGSLVSMSTTNIFSYFFLVFLKVDYYQVFDTLNKLFITLPFAAMNLSGNPFDRFDHKNTLKQYFLQIVAHMNFTMAEQAIGSVVYAQWR